MVHQLRAIVALAEGLDLALNIYIVTCLYPYYSFRASDTLFRTSRAPGMYMVYISACKYSCI